MPPIRFRIRTIMVAIVVLGVFMGALRVLTLSGLSVRAGIQDSHLFILIGVPMQVRAFCNTFSPFAFLTAARMLPSRNR